LAEGGRLPAVEGSAERFALGYVIKDYARNRLFRLQQTHLAGHACVVGRTGSGKSTTAKILIYELARRDVPVLVLDRTGEYAVDLSAYVKNVRALAPGESLCLAPFELEKGEDLEEQVEDWLSLLDHYALTTWGNTLSPLQTRLLYDSLISHYHHTDQTLTLSQLVREIRIAEKTVPLHGWAESVEALVSRFRILVSGRFRRVFDQKHSTLDISRLFERATSIVDLSRLGDDRAKNLVSQVISKQVYEYARKLGRAAGLRLVYVVDEAAHLAPDLSRTPFLCQLGILERIAVGLRKYGVSLVTIATRPSHLSENILANATTFIAHTLTNWHDQRRALANLGIPDWRKEGYQQILMELPVGTALIRTPNPEDYLPVKVEIGLYLHEPLIRGTEKPYAPTLTTPTDEDNGTPPPVRTTNQTPYTLTPWMRKALADLITNGPSKRKHTLRLTRKQTKTMQEMGLITVGEEETVEITTLGERVAKNPE